MDLIDRQALLDKFEPWLKVKDYNDGELNMLKAILYEIRFMPPAQPKMGKWILDRSGAYCCSECMEPCATYVMMKPRDKFCKMCGSRNEVTE